MQAKNKNFCFLGKPPHAFGRHANRKREQEHPHMRGEDWQVYSQVRSGTSPHAWGRHNTSDIQSCGRGTSPHAWGRLRSKRLTIRYGRNIPTCVGKTLKMLSKIKHLTFSKVPFSLTFKSCPKISVFLFSLLFVFQRASFHPTSVVWNVTLIPHKKVPVKNSTMNDKTQLSYRSYSLCLCFCSIHICLFLHCVLPCTSSPNSPSVCSNVCCCSLKFAF